MENNKVLKKCLVIGVIGSYFVVSKMFSLDFDLLFMLLHFIVPFILFWYRRYIYINNVCGVGDHL